MYNTKSIKIQGTRCVYRFESGEYRKLSPNALLTNGFLYKYKGKKKPEITYIKFTNTDSGASMTCGTPTCNPPPTTAPKKKVPHPPLSGESCESFIKVKARKSSPGSEHGVIRFSSPERMSNWKLQVHRPEYPYYFAFEGKK